MNFLEARRLVASFEGGPALRFLFGLGGTPDPFRLYLEAAATLHGRRAAPRFLPFNTLQQHLAGPAAEGELEAFLLLPWDLVPELDWRSGLPVSPLDPVAALERAEAVVTRLGRRRGARHFWLPAPIPPATGTTRDRRILTAGLESLAAGLDASPLPAAAFSLGGYFGSGCPVAGASLGAVAVQVMDRLCTEAETAAKVLVTDLDNTLWSGVIAEDGQDGIAFGPEGAGYRHYLYQGTLARLRREGVVLAAVSRNDADVVMPPLRSGRMLLGEADFVAIRASYHAKSAAIRQLAEQLNLGLDAFVFVDDNPVEREEVQAVLPAVRVLAFPARDDSLPGFLDEVVTHFGRTVVTEEDRMRTELYRRRLDGLPPADAEGADLTAFLAGLEMRLVIHDRSTGDRARAVQLINKTNQFNANGRRWTDEEVAEVLGRGGRLIGASLHDRSGGHGEILSCLVGVEGVIEALVMSCRVFQRRVEYGFFCALADRGVRTTAVRYAATERNEPFRRFAADELPGGSDGDCLPWDLGAFVERHADCRRLFVTTWE